MFKGYFWNKWLLLGLLKAGKSAAITSTIIAVSLTSSMPAEAATRYETGISTSGTLLWMNDRDLDNRLTSIRNLGATWIRVDFNWPAIQPDSANTYHWKPFDRLVRVAGIHHLKVLAVMSYTPKWAQDPKCAKLVITRAAGEKCNAKSPDLFGRFARAAAIRYKGTSLRAWEIWNEPNLSAYWKTVQADGKAVHSDPIAYARFANAAAIQIRHNYPQSIILTGGLSPLYEPKYPKGMRQSDFLAAILPHLRYDVFDGIGIHPYSWPALPTTPAPYNAFYTVDQGNPQFNLKAIATKAGWGKKQLWATEYGASTKGLRSVGTPLSIGRPDHVTEDIQAQIVKQGMDAWYAKPNVGPLFIHSDSDKWLPASRNLDGFGLQRSDGSKKPAYSAYAQASARLQVKKLCIISLLCRR